MDLSTFLRTVVRPGLGELSLNSTISPGADAERFLVAIALQESDATHRYQHSPARVPGPARGFWQFEINGVLGVMSHNSSSVLVKEACLRAGVVLLAEAVHRAIEGHDRLAVQIARLLILTHPDPLPQTAEAGWTQYLNLWRPGRPHPDRWANCWRQAHQAVFTTEVPDADTQAGSV